MLSRWTIWHESGDVLDVCLDSTRFKLIVQKQNWILSQFWVGCFIVLFCFQHVSLQSIFDWHQSEPRIKQITYGLCSQQDLSQDAQMLRVYIFGISKWRSRAWRQNRFERMHLGVVDKSSRIRWCTSQKRVWPWDKNEESKHERHRKTTFLLLSIPSANGYELRGSKEGDETWWLPRSTDVMLELVFQDWEESVQHLKNRLLICIWHQTIYFIV